MTLQDSLPAAQAYSVPVTLPAFMEDEPDTWFLAVEAQFALRGVNQDECKFDLVYARLPPHLMRSMARKIPEYQVGSLYSTLKTDVLHYFSKGRLIIADQILRDSKINYEQKPSFALEEIWQKIKNNHKDLVYAVWIRTLPPPIAAKINESWLDDEKKLKENADQLFTEFKYSQYQRKNANSSAPVSHVDHDRQIEPSFENETVDVSDSETDYCCHVRQLPEKRKTQQKPSQSFRPTHRKENSFVKKSQPRVPQDPTDSVCCFHYTFGKHAQRCVNLKSGKSCPLASTLRPQGNSQPGR